jgi:hypothetical protein
MSPRVLVGLTCLVVALTSCGASDTSPAAPPNLGGLHGHRILVVVDRRGSGAYDRLPAPAGRRIAVEFACTGGGGAELATASSVGEWQFAEIQCNGGIAHLGVSPPLQPRVSLRVRVAPSERWSLVAASTSATG